VALELGKLSAVAWLGRAGCAVHPARPLKTAIRGLIGVLMALNAVGAYGFLSKAHIAQKLTGTLNVAGHAADVEARLAVQASIVADLDRTQLGLERIRLLRHGQIPQLRRCNDIR
jgi:hypothetical protein